MTYAEFKNYCMTHLWKTGDSVVIAALDTIIATAEAELNRVFKVEDRITIVALNVSTATPIPLPTDYRQLRHLYSTSVGEMKYNIPADYANKLAAGSLCPNDYTVANNSILLPTYNVGDVLQCWYYRDVPKYSALLDTQPNWIVEDYFDVYLYAVLKHTAPFLREDERLTTWNDLFTTAFGSAMEENAERKYAGSPLKMKFSRSIR